MSTTSTSPPETLPSHSTTEMALKLNNVTKRFGKVTAVNGISLNVPRGSIYGFLGPNGAGKTTLIRMVMSIFYPDSGSIRVLDHDNAESVKDRLGYLPEEKGLYKKMKAGEILTYFGRLKGMDGTEAKEKGRELMTRYGLGDWIDTPCEALSKGMGQKVQILGTIIHDPELVILDEPFSGLDPVNIELMREIIQQMKRDGRTVIFSTHIMEQAERICDFIFLINKGQKILNGTLTEIKATGDRGILIDYDGDGDILKTLPGIQRINDSGKQAEIYLQPGVDPQSVLSAIVGSLTIKRFDLREPSLHEIFVRVVGENAG